MKWTAAELLDTMRGRTGGGEHGYDEGTSMVASAMAGEREGKELERGGGVWGVRGRERDRSSTSPGEGSGEAASRCVAHAAVAVGHLPACLAEAARWSGAGLGRQVGWLVGCGGAR